MFEWLISPVPWQAWLAAVIVAVVAMWRFFGWQGALAAAAGFIAALSYGKGRAEGKAIIEAEQKERRDALQAEYDRIDAGPIDPGGAYDRLRQRSKDSR